MKLGIIGLSGSGKKTLFEAFTGISDDGSHKTEDRIGTVTVPDERIDFLSNMYKPKKTIYAKVEYFLPNIRISKNEPKKDENIWGEMRNCDALIHVIRNFKAYGLEEPQAEKDFVSLDEEMIFADLVVVEKRIERLKQDNQRGKKVNPEEMALLEKCLELLENNIPLSRNEEIQTSPLLKGYAFVSAKPMLVLFNNEDEDENLPEMPEKLKNEECMIARGKLEQELSQMTEEEAQEFLEEFSISASAMDRVIEASYNLLGIMSFFTVGEDEVRAWTIKKESQAPEAAGAIHTDFQKGFIRAEVLAYNDLLNAGTYNNAKKKGTVRLEGKTYIVQDGDIINFRFNV